jgi:hypothetical protein
LDKSAQNTPVLLREIKRNLRFVNHRKTNSVVGSAMEPSAHPSPDRQAVDRPKDTTRAVANALPSKQRARRTNDPFAGIEMLTARGRRVVLKPKKNGTLPLMS